MEVAEMKKYCQTMSREIIVKNHNIGIEVIEDLKNLLDLSLCSFTFKVFLVKSESSWMIISDCHGSSSDKTIVGYRPLSTKKFELSPDLKKFVNLNFPTAATMKVIDLPNDLEDGSLSVLLCLGPLLLSRRVLKFDVFTRYRNVHCVLKKCIVDGKLLHLQPSDFMDSYSTEEERVEFVAIKTKKEIADEKLNLSVAKKFAEQILRNSLLSATTREADSRTTEDVSSLPAPSNFDLETDSSLSSEDEVRGISDKLKNEIAYFSALRAQDNDPDSDFEYPELQNKKRKAAPNKTRSVKRSLHSNQKKSSSRKIKTSAIMARRKNKDQVPGSDNFSSGAEIGTSGNDEEHDSIKLRSKLPKKCTNNITCPYFAKEHFHCSNCDKISNSLSVIKYHCKNSSMCVPKIQDEIGEEPVITAVVLSEPESSDNVDLLRSAPQVTGQYSDIRVSNPLHPANDVIRSDSRASPIKVGAQAVEQTMDNNLEKSDECPPLDLGFHDVCSSSIPLENVRSCSLFVGGGRKKKSCFDLKSNKLFQQFHYHCKMCLYSSDTDQAVINHIKERHMSAVNLEKGGCTINSQVINKDSSCSNDETVTRQRNINNDMADEEVMLKNMKGEKGDIYSKQNVDGRIIACWKTGEHCKIRKDRGEGSKHYHCSVCLEYASTNQNRVVDHYKKHHGSQNCLNSRASGSVSSKNDLLQCEVVDEEKCIYLVRGAGTGPGKPVTVQIHPKNMECSSHHCIQDGVLAEKSGVNDYFCQHIKSCMSINTQTNPEGGLTNKDLFKIDFLSNNKDISDSDKNIINSMLLTKATTRSPLVRSFLPQNNQGSSPRNIYLSVLYCGSEAKPYAPFGRVTVTYSVVNKTISCACNHNSTNARCKHSIIGMIVINNCFREYTNGQKSTEISSQVLDEIEYVYKNKKIPFDMDRKVMFSPTPMTKFTPHETQCHKPECGGDLKVTTKTKSGFLFTLENKVNGITIENKTCVKCGFTYRYQEWKDGWHNFNNSSIFSIRFLERVLNSWVVGTSLSSVLTVLQQEIPRELHYTFNEHLIGNAAKHYLALKEFEGVDELHCLECGFYPMILVYDAIINVCADLKPDEVVFDEASRYIDFDDVKRDCCRVTSCEDSWTLKK